MDFKSIEDVLNYAKLLPLEARQMVFVTLEDLYDDIIDYKEASENIAIIFSRYAPVQ